MINYESYFFHLSIIFLASCTSSGEKETVSIPKLKEEVMAVHDEVMPKMGELRKVEKELKLLANEDSTRADWVAVADKIASANQSMMVWMRGYEPDFQGTDEEVISYLQDQKTKIELVKEEMLTSLQEGKQLLENQ